MFSSRGYFSLRAELTARLSNSADGICVDIHVHRISNRLGWVRTWRKDTGSSSPAKGQDPELTRKVRQTGTRADTPRGRTPSWPWLRAGLIRSQECANRAMRRCCLCKAVACKRDSELRD